MTKEDEIEYLHQQAQEFVQHYGFKLVPVDKNSTRLVKADSSCAGL